MSLPFEKKVFRKKKNQRRLVETFAFNQSSSYITRPNEFVQAGAVHYKTKYSIIRLIPVMSIAEVSNSDKL